VRQVHPRARQGGTATGVTSPGNTAEPSRELSVGDVVAIGEVTLAVGRPAGWTAVGGDLNESRADQHGTHPLRDPSWLPGASTRAAQVPAISPCKEPGT
jgi:hypothetical protein